MFLFDNILKFKVHFQSKSMLIQWLNEKDWIKSMYKKYIIYINLMFMVHATTLNKSKLKRKRECSTIRSLLLYMLVVFSFFFKYVMPLLFKKCQKHIFNGFFIDNFLNGPRFNLRTLICINPPKTFIQKFH
jgi:hypothetical protein